ncbi:MAG: RluA family pseudouridine synthase [Candidatus Omnitrophica bacterium]|nr:RluA family pseudouridine synthase [Candidatus Omnitrophota bacterium]
MDRKIIVTKEFAGKRLDRFLTTQISELSRTKISNLISSGKVFVDGLSRKPSFCLRETQQVRISLEEEKQTLVAYDFPVKIIYDDDDLIVVDKPTGLVVHPPQKGYDKTLVNALIHLGKDLAETSDLRPGVVHRLDKETSGVMVLVKNQQSYENLVDQFKSRKVKKEYLAWVWGKIKKDKFNIDLPLSRDSKNRLKMKVSFLASKKAYTKAEVVKRLEETTCLRLMPITGRMHQLRVHLKFLGYPIVGDKKYGVKDNYRELLLHACVLSFIHPKSNKLLKFTSPIPERFSSFSREHI